MGDFQKNLNVKPQPNPAAQAMGKEPKLTQQEPIASVTQPQQQSNPQVQTPQLAQQVQPTSTAPMQQQTPMQKLGKEPNLIRQQGPLIGLLMQLQNRKPGMGGK